MALKQSNNGQFALPTAPSAGTTVAQSASANTYGSFVALTASTGEADYITAVNINAVTGGNELYVSVNIGTGAGGSETTVGIVTITPAAIVSAAAEGGSILIIPPIPVPNATRIAVKTASNIASAINWSVNLTLCKQADLIDAGINESSDIQTIKTQTVTCSAGVTVNVNVGTTQPVNFSGSGASAFVKADVEQWIGVAPNALNAGRVDAVASIRSSTAQTGSTGSTIKLDASASATDNIYQDCLVLITGGTGVSQVRSIQSYVGSTKVATIFPAWTTTPDNTSTFTIIPMSQVDVGNWLNGTATAAATGIPDVNVKNMNNISAGSITTVNANQGTPQPVNFTGTAGSALVKSDAVDIAGAAVSATTAQIGVNVVNWNNTVVATPNTAGVPIVDSRSTSLRVNTAQSGTANSITLDAGATGTTDLYKGAVVAILSGNGAGQSRIITAYGSGIATVSPNWVTNPNNTSVFAILPGQADVEAWVGSATNALISGRVDANTQATAASLAFNLTGNITGNLSGSVGSVTGAVGSVTGAVGSVTGNVGGNVVGSVASVTGNVGGNVVGSVGSVVAAVTLSAGDSPVIQSGTASAGGASTITIQTALGTTADIVGCLIKITSGTGANQCRVITAYVNATKVVTVDYAWVTAPDATSVYSILANNLPSLNSSLKIAGVVLTDTLTTYTGNTVQTGDSFARIGAAGVGLTNLGDTRIAHLDADVSSRMATYTQPTGFLAATFPSGTVANTTNITAGTITTVTNLTNAPTAGDFTATMKTSLNNSTPASITGAVGSVTGNVGGNVVGSVGSVVAAVTLSAGDSPVVQTGTASAGGASTITIQTALGADNLCVGETIKITSGTGSKQARVIVSYVDSTKVVTVDRAWTTNPDATSVYAILYTDAPKTDSSLQVTATGSGTFTANVTQWLGGTPLALSAQQVQAVVPSSTVVASVTGSVGSVTGNVSGNVVGSVASVTADVGITQVGADKVWDTILANHLTPGSTGFALNAAGSSGDPWGTILPGVYTTGMAGNILGNITNIILDQANTIEGAWTLRQMFREMFAESCGTIAVSPSGITAYAVGAPNVATNAGTTAARITSVDGADGSRATNNLTP